MRYWQVTTRRFSRAAQALDMDGEWHSFHSDALSWYRVWRKKLIQRASFESEVEQAQLLSSVRKIEPITELARTSGFREELTITFKDDLLMVMVPLGYVPSSESMKELKKSVGPIAELIEESNLLSAKIPLKHLTTSELIAIQETIAAVRSIFSELSK